MSQKCRTCALGPEKVHEIEKKYLGGVNCYRLAREAGVSYDSIKFHMAHHLPNKLMVADKKTKTLQANNLLQHIDDLYYKVESLYDRHTGKHDTLALKALAELKNILELLTKISFSLREARLEEREKEQEHRLVSDTDEVDLSCLSQKEKNIYFEITQKLIDSQTNGSAHNDNNTYDEFSDEADEIDYTDETETEETGEDVENESMIRTKPRNRRSSTNTNFRRTKTLRKKTKKHRMKFKPIHEPEPDLKELRRAGRHRRDRYNEIDFPSENRNLPVIPAKPADPDYFHREYLEK